MKVSKHIQSRFKNSTLCNFSVFLYIYSSGDKPCDLKSMDDRLITNLWPLCVKVLHFQDYDLWIWPVNGKTKQKLQWII